jgi:hypothetical protein
MSALSSIRAFEHPRVRPRRTADAERQAIRLAAERVLTA